MCQFLKPQFLQCDVKKMKTCLPMTYSVLQERKQHKDPKSFIMGSKVIRVLPQKETSILPGPFMILPPLLWRETLSLSSKVIYYRKILEKTVCNKYNQHHCSQEVQIREIRITSKKAVPPVC